MAELIFEDFIYTDIESAYFVEVEHENQKYYVTIWEDSKFEYLLLFIPLLKDPILELEFSDEHNPMEEIAKAIIKYEKVRRVQLKMQKWDKVVSLEMFPEMVKEEEEEQKRFKYREEVKPKIFVWGEEVKTE